MDREEQQLQQAVEQATAEVNRLQQELQRAEGRKPGDQDEVNGILVKIRDAKRAELDAIRNMRQTMEGWNRNLQKALNMVKGGGGRPEQ